MSVKQSIKVTNAGLSPILSVAQGTGAIKYEFTVSDFDIPSGSAAVAYNIQPTGNIVSQTCSISGNTITVKPPAYYFLRGKNYMQFQVSRSNEDLFSFLIEVWCAPNISQPEVIVAENPSLVSQLISDIGLLSSQLDNLLSIPSGSLSTSADAALADIKVGWDGTTYDTPGDAVRGQIGELKGDLAQLQSEKELPLMFWKQAWFNNSAIYEGSQYSYIIDVKNVKSVDVISGYVSQFFNFYTLLDSNFSVIGYLRNESSTEHTFNGIIDVTNANYLVLTNNKQTTSAMLCKAITYDDNRFMYYSEMHVSEETTGYYSRNTFNADTAKLYKYDVSRCDYVLLNTTTDLYKNQFTLLKNGAVDRYYYWDNALKIPPKNMLLYVGDCDTLCISKGIVSSIVFEARNEKISNIKKGFGFYKNGIATYDQSQLYSIYNVEKSESVLLSGIVYPYYDKYVLLDKNMKVIEFSNNNSSSNVNLNNENIDVRKATYLIVCDSVKAVIGENDFLTSDLQKTMNLVNVNDWKDKKVVWFGTSIPASGEYNNQNNNSAYPNKLAKILGFTVYNESVGGSCMHCKDANRISEENPYGFVNDFGLASKCLTNSRVEMQWVIDNYDSGVFTVNVPSSLSDETKTNILNCSYETKLNKYLSGGSVGNCDLYVLNHGWNDGHNTLAEDKAIMEQYGEDTLYCYSGAMNWILKKIYSNNPHSKVCMIGEIRGHSICELQENVADDWNIPICKLRQLLGWPDKEITTTGYWSDSYPYWVSSGGESHTMKVFETWLKDGIHPHSDLSGRALWHCVTNLIPFFMNEIRFY